MLGEGLDLSDWCCHGNTWCCHGNTWCYHGNTWCYHGNTWCYHGNMKGAGVTVVTLPEQQPCFSCNCVSSSSRFQSVCVFVCLSVRLFAEKVEMESEDCV